MTQKAPQADLANRNVWQLSLEEIDYVYSQLHMNSYVYAALKVYHQSSPPAGKKLMLKNGAVPDSIRGRLREFIELAGYIGRDDPGKVRVHCTYRSFKLMQTLRGITLEELKIIIPVFALTAFIPVLSDKNDNFPLWSHSVVRESHPDRIRLYEALDDHIDIDEYIRLPFFNETLSADDTISPVESLFAFMPRAVSSVIARIERIGNTEEITRAFLRIERAMRDYEEKHNLCGPGKSPLNVKYSGQIRYRNTLYLYGGNHFERIGDCEKAFDWYCRDIYTLLLPNYCGFYLTDFKTCERLIRAYPLYPEARECKLFPNLIDHMILKSFHKSAEYAMKVLDYIDMHSDVDLSKERLEWGDGRPMLYGGEAMREIFLLSLLYEHYVQELSFTDLDYSEIFEFV